MTQHEDDQQSLPWNNVNDWLFFANCVLTLLLLHDHDHDHHHDHHHHGRSHYRFRTRMRIRSLTLNLCHDHGLQGLWAILVSLSCQEPLESLARFPETNTK